jgi:hypothetical protein
MEAVYVASWGLVVANLMLLNVRAFAKNHGLAVRWLSRSYAPERQHLRMLARNSDPSLARRARFNLRLEILAWVTFSLTGVPFMWARRCRLSWSKRNTPPRHGWLSTDHHPSLRLVSGR